jgi:hypothetical protein
MHPAGTCDRDTIEIIGGKSGRLDLLAGSCGGSLYQPKAVRMAHQPP